MARQFLVRLVVFSVPILIIVLLILGSGFYFGDTIPTWRIVQLQDRDEPVVYGGVNYATDFTYKVNLVRHRKPEVVILGSSRSNALGPFLVDTPDFMVNAWTGGMPAEYAMLFLEAIDQENPPKVLLWCIDQRFFVGDELDSPPYIGEYDFQGMVSNSVQADLDFLQTLREQRTIPPNLIERTEPFLDFSAFGIDSLRGNPGFLNHGEVYSGQNGISNYENSTAARRHSRHRRAFEARELQYRPGRTISAHSLDVITAVLDYAQQKNIYVIGYVSPFSPFSYSWFSETNDFEYLDQIEAEAEPIFERFGYRFFDFTDPSSIPLTDADFLDSYHLTQGASIRLYQKMLAAVPEILGTYSSNDRLDDLLAASEGDPFLLAYYLADSS